MYKRVFIFCACCILAFVAKAQEAVTLTVSDINIMPGGRVRLAIDSDVALYEYCSFQFDVLLPEGLTMPFQMNPGEEEMQYGYYDEDEEKWVPAVSSGICKSTHVLEYSATQGGYRFVCYNSKFAVFKSGSTNVLTIVLDASEDIANGIYRIEVGGENVFIANETKHIIPSAVAGKAVVTGSEKEVSYQFEMTKAEWGTLILPFDADIPANLKAYSCSKIDEDNVILVPNKKLFANTPYVLNGTADTYSFVGVPSVKEQTTYSSGLLTGVCFPTPIVKGYVLQKIDGEVAFYRVDSTDPITIPAGRCYLEVESENAPAFRLHSTSDIDGVISEAPMQVFELSGNKVDHMDKGVYILGNKKVIVK